MFLANLKVLWRERIKGYFYGSSLMVSCTYNNEVIVQ
jgi:hypothetical protein